MRESEEQTEGRRGEQRAGAPKGANIANKDEWKETERGINTD